MTVADFLSHLEGVKRTARGWQAKCPAHQDRSPSLSIAEGREGVLTHCFAGCETSAIVEAMGLTMAALFFNAPDSRTAYRERVRRTQERQRKAQREEVNGFAIDALREADYFVRSRQGFDISSWTSDQLDTEIETLADAWELLWAEELAQWM